MDTDRRRLLLKCGALSVAATATNGVALSSAEASARAFLEPWSGSFSDIGQTQLSSSVSTVRLTDRGQAVLARSDRTSTLPASGEGRWWTRDKSGRLFVLSSELTSEALGAARDGLSDDLPILKEMIEVAAPHLKKTARISPGVHSLRRSGVADAIHVPSGVHISFDAGAKVKGPINLGGRYVPFFAVVEQDDVTIDGRKDKQFLFTNRLSYGHGQDFLTADPSFEPNVVVDARLGSSTPYSAYVYAAGICVLQSHNISISGLGCESVDGASVTPGPAFVHAFLQSAGDCNRLSYADIDADDVVLGAACQGGDDSPFAGYLRLGRASQDIGIPGHARYDFRRGLIIGETHDTGQESGGDLTRQIGHSVSYGGNGPVNIGPINSSRAQGPLNVKNASHGAIVNSITWRMGDQRIDPATGSAASLLLPSMGRIYFVTGTVNANLIIEGVVLDLREHDVEAISGNPGPGSRVSATIIRNDAMVAARGYASMSGSGYEFDLTLVQQGASDPQASLSCGGVHSDCHYRLRLVGFNRAAPGIRIVKDATGVATRCVFQIVSRFGQSDSRQLNPPLGDPYQVWLGAEGDDAAPDALIKQNILSYDDGLTTWRLERSASDGPVEARFPLPPALWDVAVTVLGGDAANPITHTERFLLGLIRPAGSGAYELQAVPDSRLGRSISPSSLTLRPNGEGYVDMTWGADGFSGPVSFTITLRRSAY